MEQRLFCSRGHFRCNRRSYLSSGVKAKQLGYMTVLIARVIPVFEPFLQLSILPDVIRVQSLYGGLQFLFKIRVTSEVACREDTSVEQLTRDCHVHRRCHADLVLLAIDPESILRSVGR